MRFSRNIGHPKLPPTQLQNFERDFWNVYLDRIFNLMLSYHQSSKDTDKMSNVAEPLKTYFSDLWNHFIDKKVDLPSSIKVFKQKMKELFCNIGTLGQAICVFGIYD